jgi:hypothetical protein
MVKKVNSDYRAEVNDLKKKKMLLQGWVQMAEK